MEGSRIVGKRGSQVCSGEGLALALAECLMVQGKRQNEIPAIIPVVLPPTSQRAQRIQGSDR